MNKKYIYIIIILILITAAVTIYYSPLGWKLKLRPVRNFEDCVKANNGMMALSYPPQCFYDGRSFIGPGTVGGR